MTDTTEPEAPDGAARAIFETSVLLRLDELGRQLERVLTLVCPVCGPDLVRQIHPEHDLDTTSPNGRVHER